MRMNNLIKKGFMMMGADNLKEMSAYVVRMYLRNNYDTRNFNFFPSSSTELLKFGSVFIISSTDSSA